MCSSDLSAIPHLILLHYHLLLFLPPILLNQATRLELLIYRLSARNYSTTNYEALFRSPFRFTELSANDYRCRQSPTKYSE